MSSSIHYKAKGERLKVLLESAVEKANEWVRFSQRKRTLDAVGFVETLVLGWLAEPKASLSKLTVFASKMGFGISRQGLQERMTSRAVVLMMAVLREALQNQCVDERLVLPSVSSLSAIWITDSTQIALPADLHDQFPGNVGNSMVKLQVSVDYLSGQLVFDPLEAGKTPDQKCDLPVRQAQAGSLQLFDLGYFSQERLKQIAERDAYFLCRYQAQTALYDATSHQRMELLDLLPINQPDFTWYGELGAKAHVSIRLVAHRVSPQIAHERRRKARATAKKQGKTCSERYLRLQDWDVLITNLDPTLFPTSFLFALYGLRWQIELDFRTWKSQLALACIRGKRIESIFCQLYAHLIGAVLVHQWTVNWRYRATIEYSLPKLLHLISTSIPRLLHVIRLHWYGLSAFWQALEKDFRQFAFREKRLKSPSTFQTVNNWDLT